VGQAFIISEEGAVQVQFVLPAIHMMALQRSLKQFASTLIALGDCGFFSTWESVDIDQSGRRRPSWV
jgi:hypothetical protein